MKNRCSQVVLQNFFEPCILFYLLQKPGYGYEIQKKLKEGCYCDVNTGNLYRCLARLQKQKYVTKRTEKSELGPKKFAYTITKEGEAYLKSWIDALSEQNKAITQLITNFKSHYEHNSNKNR